MGGGGGGRGCGGGWSGRMGRGSGGRRDTCGVNMGAGECVVVGGWGGRVMACG